MPLALHLSLFAAWTDAWVPCDILPLTNYMFLCPSSSDRGRGLLVQPLSAAYQAQHGLSLFLAKGHWWIGWRSERLTELSSWNTINSRTQWWTHKTWVNTEDFVLQWGCSFSGCSLLFICLQPKEGKGTYKHFSRHASAVSIPATHVTCIPLTIINLWVPELLLWR